MKREVVIDTNCIVRFLLDERPKSLKVEAILERKDVTIYLSEVVLAEVVWVLSSFYKVPKDVLCDKLQDFLLVESIECDHTLMFKVLSMFRQNSISFIDAYLAAFAENQGAKLFTFDNDFKHINGFNSLF